MPSTFAHKLEANTRQKNQPVAEMTERTDRPILFYGEQESSNKITNVYMIQAAFGPPEEPFPGLPLAIFYDYSEARAAFDTYENPMSSCLRDTVIVAFLTTSIVSPYGILTHTQICAHKTNKDVAPQLVSIWG
jgi:hypothetical protein